MKKAKLFVFLSLIVAATAPAAINAQETFRLTIASQVLAEERSIIVRVPAGYTTPGSRFPVLYMLDGHEPQLTMMAGILDHQAAAGRNPEIILVGIQNTNRTRDMTPTKTERPNSGGGDKFLEFIASEVVPQVEKNYRTQSYRIFAGHSLGGLTVFHAATSKPELFNAYIAASPVLHWDKGFVIKRTEELLKTPSKTKKPLFVALGNEADYIQGFNSLKDILKKNGSDVFDFETQQWLDEDHGSIVLRAYFSGLRRVYSDWPAPASGTVADVESHYKKLSKKYGYEIPPPENLINQIGYALLRQNNAAEAIRIFRKNVEMYPNSANVYDSLAEALEKNGSLDQARSNYEKAYKIADQQGNKELARLFKASFDRLAAAN